jgi:hypothetical protein
MEITYVNQKEMYLALRPLLSSLLLVVDSTCGALSTVAMGSLGLQFRVELCQVRVTISG